MPDTDDRQPRLLLVEDDPVSASFIGTVLSTLPASVDIAGSCDAALERPSHYDLWLIDANLPDGSGSALLRQARQRDPALRALAHTADTSPTLHARLRAEGFADVLAKPLAAQALLAAVREALGMPAAPAPPGAVPGLPDWDEEAALRALHGRQQHVLQLRQLFLDELPGMRRAIVDAAAGGDAAAMREVLHRLRASCGFVGAARLGDAVGRLHDTPGSATALEDFIAVCSGLEARSGPL
ncbi:response regulator [Pseudoxanthomonas mexicana]|uniref:response regulator n=1 Tax=Pseudoxanthomonas mexicana TaxID=128785 RepID=UPI00398B0C0C